MFELGRWDLKTGPNKEDAQMSMGGVARTSETWDQAEPSLVRIWRLAGPKITYENLTIPTLIYRSKSTMNCLNLVC